MKRVIGYKPNLGEAALLILDQLTTATLKTLYPHPYYHVFCRHAHPRSFYNALKRFERKHLVGTRTKEGKEEWQLTPEGERVARILKAKIESARQGKWDKKWRLIIFDVPEKMRGRRDFLRRELHSLGFHQLQKSVWASPYPLSSEFGEILKELQIARSFRIVLAESIQDDDDLCDVFFPRA